MYRITVIAFIFIGLFSSFTGYSCCAEDSYGNLTELLNDPIESRYPYHSGRSIFTIKIYDTSNNPRQGFKNIGIVQKVYRGNLEVGQKVTINSGGNSSAGGRQLFPGDEYIIFSRAYENTYFSAFVCDRFSRRIKHKGKYVSDQFGKDYIKVIDKYFKLKNSNYTGEKTFKLGKAVLAKGSFKDGLPHGDWKHYQVQGKKSLLKSEIQYQDGLPHGKEKIYQSHQKRTLRSVTTFDKGKELHKLIYTYLEDQIFLSHESKTVYLKDNSTQKSITNYHYKKDQIREKLNETSSNVNVPLYYFSYRFRDGKYISYFENGQVQEKGEYYRGARIHEWYIYNEDGSLKEKKYYKKPEATELFVVYHKEGAPRVLGKLNHGVKVGQWRFYSNEGNLIKTKNFENGLIQGVVKGFWSKEKTLQSLSNYKDNVLNGESRTFYKDGTTPSSITLYNHGKKEGILKEYFKDGKLRATSLYKKGKLHGESIRYHSPNVIKSVRNYDNGILNGEYKNYNKEGELISEGSYKKGKKTTVND